MNQAIIDKYNLVDTKSSTGESFIYDIKIYHTKELEENGGFLAMKCSEDGKPSEFITIIGKMDRVKVAFKVTEDFMIDSKFEIIKQLIQSEVCAYLKNNPNHHGQISKG